MIVADARFGGELVTKTGRILVFDDVGCLAAYLGREEVGGGTESLWVADYLAPGALLSADDAIFLLSDSFRTPMNYRLAATAPGPAADSLARSLGARVMTWQEVLRIVERHPTS